MVLTHSQKHKSHNTSLLHPVCTCHGGDLFMRPVPPLMLLGTEAAQWRCRVGASNVKASNAKWLMWHPATHATECL